MGQYTPVDGVILLKTQIRILHIITKMVVGGASISVKLITSRLDRTLFEPFLAYGPGEPEDEELPPPANVEAIRLPDLVRPLSPYRDWQALRQLRQVIRQVDPAIIHTHSSKAGILGRLAGRIARVPVIVHHVRGYSFHEHQYRWKRQFYVTVERLASKHCDALLFVGKRMLDKFLEQNIGKQEMYHIVRSGVDLKDFAPRTPRSTITARNRLQIGEDAFVVGTVGRLSAPKSPVDFVAAAQYIAQKLPGAFFVWIGDGELRRQTEQAIERAGLRGRFLLMGNCSDVGELYPAFDVFMLTSLWEGLPRTVVEALATGVPVVATAVGGNCEIIRHEHNGLLAAPGDPQAAAVSVLRLSDDKQLSRQLAGNGPPSAQEFSIEKTVADLSSLYMNLLREKQ